MPVSVQAFGWKGSAIALALMLAASSSALAQPQPAAAHGARGSAVAAGITIIAPKIVRRETTGAAKFPGAPVELLSLSRTVEFADLNLATESGAIELQKRIMYSALAACDELESRYPSNIYVPVPAAQNCPDATARAGLAVADDLIAAAKNGRGR